MILIGIGLCLISGGIKGMVDNSLKPKPPRPPHEHAPFYL